MFFYFIFFYFWLFFLFFFFFKRFDSVPSALHQDSSLGLNPGESRMYPSLSELTGGDVEGTAGVWSAWAGFGPLFTNGTPVAWRPRNSVPPGLTLSLNSRWMNLCFLFHQTQPRSPRSEDSTRHLTAPKSLLDDVWFVLNLDFNVDFTWVSFASLWCVLYGDHFRGQMDKLL